MVKRARELVPEDPWAAKAWLITARTLYPADFNIQVRTDNRQLLYRMPSTSFTVLLQNDITQHALLRIGKTSGNTPILDTLGTDMNPPLPRPSMQRDQYITARYVGGESQFSS